MLLVRIADRGPLKFTDRKVDQILVSDKKTERWIKHLYCGLPILKTKFGITLTDGNPVELLFGYGAKAKKVKFIMRV